jgi:hypothetical protein
MKVWTWASLAPTRSWTKRLAARSSGSSAATGVVSRAWGAARAAKPRQITVAQNSVRASTIRHAGTAAGRLKTYRNSTVIDRYRAVR